MVYVINYCKAHNHKRPLNLGCCSCHWVLCQCWSFPRLHWLSEYVNVWCTTPWQWVLIDCRNWCIQSSWGLVSVKIRSTYTGWSDLLGLICPVVDGCRSSLGQSTFYLDLAYRTLESLWIPTEIKVLETIAPGPRNQEIRDPVKLYSFLADSRGVVKPNCMQ